MHLYHPDTPHDFRHALAKVSAFNQVKPRPTCSPLGLGATGLPIKKPLLFPVNALTFMEVKQS